eukprot:SAG31_NODE_35850_length_319_cov_0.731818_1_plen_25_part_01
MGRSTFGELGQLPWCDIAQHSNGDE